MCPPRRPRSSESLNAVPLNAVPLNVDGPRTVAVCSASWWLAAWSRDRVGGSRAGSSRLLAPLASAGLARNVLAGAVRSCIGAFSTLRDAHEDMAGKLVSGVRHLLVSQAIALEGKPARVSLQLPHLRAGLD